MNEIREVHYVDGESRSNTLVITFFIICVAALIAIAAFAWHPWTAPEPGTTIIHEQAPPAVNPPPNTTIVTPPAPESRTDIRIDNTKEGNGTNDGSSLKEDQSGGGSNDDSASSTTGTGGSTDQNVPR